MLSKNLDDMRSLLNECRELANSSVIFFDSTKFATTLHYAVFENWLEGVKLLAENIENIDLPDELDNTPLHIATKKGHYDITTILVNRYNASIIREDNDGRNVFNHSTPLL